MAEEETPETTGNNKQPFLRRGQDYESLYANHVAFQPSEWDLKLTFGELDKDKDDFDFVAQHTAIAVPWLQAKIMNYFLTLQLGVFEMTHGKIPIPPSVLPQVPDSAPSDADAHSRQVIEYIKKVRDEFFGSPIS